MMTQKRSTIWHWFLDGKIAPANLKAAMLEVYPHPNAKNWQLLIANILLYLGVLLFGAGVIFSWPSTGMHYHTSINLP
jgi:hypothetical protein